MSDDDDDDGPTTPNANNGSPEIGYKNPPSPSKFKKGVSGNPDGRPKNSPSLFEMLLNEMDKRVPIKTNGKPSKMRNGRLVAMQLVKSAANGKIQSQALLFKQIEKAEARRDAKKTKAEAAAKELNDPTDARNYRWEDAQERLYQGLKGMDELDPDASDEEPEEPGR